MEVTILHPDFGIGGAERLMLDAALALRSKGHRVRIITNHFARDHCFPELLTFEKELEVVNWNFPRSLFGRCYALCAFIRFCIAALYICVYHRNADLILLDLVSAPLPILRLLINSKLLFYCHFPDQLLTKRNSFLKSCYRSVIDRIEAWSMHWADEVLVNSQFTESVVHDTFPALTNIRVLYPPLNCDSIAVQCRHIDNNDSDVQDLSFDEEFIKRISSGLTTMFLSINRFERKKNIELAIRSFVELRKKLVENGNRKIEEGECCLVLAGGYDRLNSENKEYYIELVKFAEAMEVQDYVKFVLSPDDLTKIWLLKHASLVLYTPDREHFGIVPLEAMFMRCPVLAVSSGGPLETIVDGESGFLRKAKEKEFSEVMRKVVEEPKLKQKMGEMGRSRVKQHFSFAAFADKLNEIVIQMRASH